GEGILEFMRHLAGEQLPARDLRQIDEPVAAVLELLGGIVEGLNRSAGFVISLDVETDIQIAGSEFAQAAGQLLDGAADAMSEIDQRNQRDAPYRHNEDDQSNRQPSAKIPLPFVGD